MENTLTMKALNTNEFHQLTILTNGFTQQFKKKFSLKYKRKIELSSKIEEPIKWEQIKPLKDSRIILFDKNSFILLEQPAYELITNLMLGGSLNSGNYFSFGKVSDLSILNFISELYGSILNRSLSKEELLIQEFRLYIPQFPPSQLLIQVTYQLNFEDKTASFSLFSTSKKFFETLDL